MSVPGAWNKTSPLKWLAWLLLFALCGLRCRPIRSELGALRLRLGQRCTFHWTYDSSRFSSAGSYCWSTICGESLQIAVIATAFGVLLSLPIGLLAARNMMPIWVTWPARLFIAVCRSFHPVITAILFVKAVGFRCYGGDFGA